MEQKHSGFWGRLLRINLNEKTNNVEEIDPNMFRLYMGGRNLALHCLLQENPEGVDPFDPCNRIVIMTSVITGASISGQGRHTIASKSPLTGGLGEAQCGGWWGAELKFAGYDGVIIEGKSEKPIYIHIKDDDVSFENASEIWGKTTGEADKILRDKYSKIIKILQIGPAGENKVLYAMITADLHHFAGRCGLGAVMGSKNLRALVVEGSQRKLKISDSEGLNTISKWFAKSIKDHPALSLHHELGTMKGVVPLNEVGLLPTYNFQDSSFDGAHKISGEEMDKQLGAGTHTCYGCAVSCKRLIEGEKDGFKVSTTYGGLEYESLCTLGPLLGVDNIYAVAMSNELCNMYGIDTISTGATLAWAIECAERGLITEKDTGGIPLQWNDPHTYHKLIHMIAMREGFGDVLAQGSRMASRIIGKDSERYAMQVKGQEFPGHEPRGKWGVGLGYAVSPTGADHLQAAHDVWFSKSGDYSDEFNWIDLEDLSPLGIIDPVPSEDIGGAKVRLFTYLQYVWSLHDVLDLCIFVTVPEFRAISLNQIEQMVRSITGWRTSLFELLKAGERGITMARAFNYREGFSADDDKLPERMFEPIREGNLKGHSIDHDEFNNALKLYYSMMGWDENGMPTEGKLEELGIGWIWKIISK